MPELIAITILGISLCGILIILFRKIPVLVDLPIPQKEAVKESLLLRLKKGINNLPPLKSFSFEVFLQKLLSKFRIFTLKTDNKTANWLQRLRERSKKNGEIKEDNYWEEIKKSKEKR